jgi:hypothetical protein
MEGMTLYVSVALSICLSQSVTLVDKARQNGGTATVSFDITSPVMSLSDLARHATMIVRGRVESAIPTLSPNRDYVVTDLTIIPIRVYRAYASVAATWPNGTVDRS